MSPNAKLLIFLILISALILRIWDLDKNPPEIFTDELSNYVSAKKVVETGKDLNEQFSVFYWGQVAPHPPIYGFTAYLSSRIFGENALGIRIPAALFGVFSVMILFLLVREITTNELTALFSAFTLSILPWHIHFSRIGWEPASLLPFFLSSILLMIKGLKYKRHSYIYISFSFAIFGLTAYSYFGSWFYSLVFLFVIILLNAHFFFSHKRLLFFGFTIWGFLIIPLFVFLNQSDLNLERASRIATFSKGINTHSLSIFIFNYFSHFNLDYLFINGDPNLRHGAQTGVLYWWMLPFILIGLLYLRKMSIDPWFKKFLLIWLLIFPLGGSLTNDGVPHAMRTFIGAPIFCIFTSLGFQYLFNSIKTNKFKFILFISILIISVFSLIIFIKKYFFIYPIISASYWQYGHKEIFSTVRSLENYYKRVCLGNLDYWGNKELIYFYLRNTNLLIIESYNNPICDQAGSIIVLPTQISYPENSKLIKNIYSPSGQLIYSILTI